MDIIQGQMPSLSSIPNGQMDGETTVEDSTRLTDTQRGERPFSAQHPLIKSQRRALTGLA